MKAGIDTERRLRGGFSVYGRLTGAMMSGRFSSRYTMFNSTTDVLLAQANWKDDRIVPHVEYELGLELDQPERPLAIRDRLHVLPLVEHGEHRRNSSTPCRPTTTSTSKTHSPSTAL